MINYEALHAIFGDTLPEAHIFFATRSNKYAPSYASLRRELGMTRAKTNRSVWLRFVEKYKEETAAPATVPVASVAVTPSTATVAPGQTKQLAAAILPGNATNKTVAWTSSNPAAATVSNTGLVSVLTGATAGVEVNIIATTADGAKTAQAKITVGAAA